ncbi:MAG TPA: hypothetical protein VGH42_13815 [Verrucomicrobiae bacterium]|jgi:hypothetical protein
MSTSLHQLISEKEFDRYRDGFEARFRANHLAFSIKYSERSPNPSLYIRLEGPERIGDICVWESGDCDLNFTAFTDRQMKSKHIQLASADAFHNHLAALFRFLVNRQLPDDDLGKELT